MTRSEFANITLAKSTLIRLAGTARDITCNSGSLWITQDGDLRDIVLAPGQRFYRDDATATIVYALAPSTATVRHARPVAAPVRSSRARRSHELVLE